MNWSATVATTNDLKNGMTLDIEGQLWTVVEFQHVKPGKGPAFVRTKLKQVMTGKVVDKTFNAGVKVEIAILEKREMNFLYKEGDDFVFMDNKNFDQMTISAATVGESSNYMLENTEAIVAIHEGNPLYIELPASVELTVTYTEPGLQGDRSSGGTKPATVETGIEVQVPLFVKQDEKIVVDTRDGSYQGRAN
jgi:elongation factor P